MTKTKIQMLQPNWQVPINVRAIITTCVGDFNLALHVNDDPDRVSNNRKMMLDVVPNSPLWLNQTHSTTVIEWDKEPYSLLDADASITRDSKKICVVMTADCLPILLTNRKGNFVAAIHAGWRGLNNGIIQETISKLSINEKKDIIAFIGPAIDQECFEIGQEVREEFIKKNDHDNKFFKEAENKDKYMANLRGIAQQRLEELNVDRNNIYNSSICTKCNSNWFFSYRQNNNTGRFASLIWLE